METERKAAAREYVEKFGLKVIWLEPRDKRPASLNGSKDATGDWNLLELAYNQFNRKYDYNVGIATGSNGNNLIVIDCDIDEEADKDGCEWLADWEHENGVKLPKTATVETGRGGSHFYYWNKSGRKIKNSANADIAVDIRGEGGYVMAPPSIHPNGREVFWDVPPDETPIAEADEVVFRLIDEVQHGRGVFDDCFVMPDEVPKHTRNTTMHKFACSLWAKSTPPDKLWARMQSVNKERFKPPINGRELRTIYNSVTKLPQGYSDEVKEQQAKKAEREKDGAKNAPLGGKFDHVSIGEWLIDENNACMIGGAPAVKIGDIYATGWGGINTLINERHRGAKICNRREVHAWLTDQAPKREISPWNLIAFQNGVFDLKSHEFRAFDDEDVFINVIPHNYNSDAGAYGDAINQFLEDVSGDDLSVYANLLETIGLCMLHVSRYEYAPVLLGRGANGKSVFMKFLRYILGDENVSTLKPKDVDKRFQAVALVGKLANLSDDIANGYLDGDSCSQIKNIATGDPIHTDVKGTDGFDFVPCCTMVFSANEFPRLADTSDGMMRRLFPIEFTQRFVGENCDKHIFDKLANEECAERAIFEAVNMLQCLIERGEMTPNNSSLRIKQEIVTDNSTVLQWIEDAGGFDNAVRNKSKELAWNDYADWARNNGVRNPVNAKTMCNQIKMYGGLTLCEFSRDDNGKRTRVFGYEKSKK